MKCVIIDDEYRGREVLAELLKTNCPEVTIVGMGNNVASAYDMISNVKPDLIFLDIEMPDGTGFDLLQRFPQPQFQTIFVTSYDQYAIQAIRFHAFDYLLKPVIVDELKTTIRRVFEEKELPQKRTKEDEILELNHKSRLDYLRLDDILMLKGDGNYTFIYTLNGKTFHTSRILRYYEDILCLPDSAFIRTHKSSIINLAYAKTFEHGTVKGIAMANGIIVEVSRRKKDEVLMRMKSYRAKPK